MYIIYKSDCGGPLSNTHAGDGTFLPEIKCPKHLCEEDSREKIRIWKGKSFICYNVGKKCKENTL